MKKYGQQDLKRIMDKRFNEDPDKTAIVDYISENKAYKYTYGKLKIMSDQVRAILERSGIHPPERVALLTKPSARSAIIMLALAYSGYTAVIPDVSLPVGEQNRLLKFSAPSAVITSDDIYENIDSSLTTSVPVFRIYDYTRRQKVIEQINTGLASPVKPDIEGSFDVVAILFSSGTTGSAKGVEVTYQAMIYATKTCIHYSFYTDEHSILHVLPLSHVAGYTTVHIFCLSGSQIGFVPEMSASCLAMGLRCYQPTHLIMIPKVYETIHKKIEAEIAKRPAPVGIVFNASRKFSSFMRKKTGLRLRWLNSPFINAALGRNMHILGCGSGACDPETIRFFMDLGLEFLNVYGSTEAAFPISGTTMHQRYPDKGVGKYDEYPFIKIRIDDGEILVKSALNMRGYFRDPESTKKAFKMLKALGDDSLKK